MRRLGLYLGRLPGFDKRGFDRRELIECVRAADACGYDSFWLPEAWERESFSTLAEIAARTDHIGLATGIINVFSRSPALIAMGAATIDEISGGRFRLGLGTSGARVVEDLHGVRYEKPLTRLREAVAIIRKLLSAERVDFDGECFKLSRFKLGFKPVRADIPIYIAALTSKSLVQLGEIADGWLPAHWPRAALARGIGDISLGAKRACRDVKQIDIAPFVNVVVSDDLKRARNEARLPIAYYVGGMGNYYHQSLAGLGFQAEADQIRALWQAGRPKEAIKAVTDRVVDAIAICGTLESCRARLDEMAEYGATMTVVPIPSGGATADKCRVIESLIG
jgi:F420-dependent oxidoreductase-like protein